MCYANSVLNLLSFAQQRLYTGPAEQFGALSRPLASLKVRQPCTLSASLLWRGVFQTWFGMICAGPRSQQDAVQFTEFLLQSAPHRAFLGEWVSLE